MAFPNNYTKFQEITIQSSKVGSNQDNMVIYVDLANLAVGPPDIFDTVRADGGDIRITKEDGTQLPREIVSIDTTLKQGEMYFRYSGTLSSTVDTIIKIWYNGIDTEPDVTSQYGRNATWVDYDLVWHGNDLTDSTGNGNTLIANGGITAGGVSGKLGLATSFDGIDDFLKISDGEFIAQDSIFISMWVNVPNITTQALYCQTDNDAFSAYTHYLSVSNDNLIYDNYNPIGGALLSSLSLTESTWQYITLNRNSTLVDFTININNAGSGIAESRDSASAIDETLLGARSISGVKSDLFAGQMDEVRISSSNNSNVDLTRHSIEYNNQNDPSTFYTVSTENQSSDFIPKNIFIN